MGCGESFVMHTSGNVRFCRYIVAKDRTESSSGLAINQHIKFWKIYQVKESYIKQLKDMPDHNIRKQNIYL